MKQVGGRGGSSLVGGKNPWGIKRTKINYLRIADSVNLRRSGSGVGKRRGVVLFQETVIGGSGIASIASRRATSLIVHAATTGACSSRGTSIRAAVIVMPGRRCIRGPSWIVDARGLLPPQFVVDLTWFGADCRRPCTTPGHFGLKRAQQRCLPQCARWGCVRRDLAG